MRLTPRRPRAWNVLSLRQEGHSSSSVKTSGPACARRNATVVVRRREGPVRDTHLLEAAALRSAWRGCGGGAARGSVPATTLVRVPSTARTRGTLGTGGADVRTDEADGIRGAGRGGVFTFGAAGGGGTSFGIVGGGGSFGTLGTPTPPTPSAALDQTQSRT